MSCSKKTTGNGIAKGVILKDGSQIQQYQPGMTKLRRDPQRVQLGEQENNTTRGLSKSGLSASGLVDQGREATSNFNFAALFSALMATAAPSENLLLDPVFDDWSNGTSAVQPAMYVGSGGLRFSQITKGGDIEPLIGRFCPRIDWWAVGDAPVLTQMVPIDLSSVGFNGLYHVPLTFSNYLISSVPGNYAQLYMSTIAESHFTPVFEIPQTWTRFEICSDFASLDGEFITLYLVRGGTVNSGYVYTDAWKLERGSFATSWVPSSCEVREILLCVPAATTSFADVVYPGGGAYGLMPPVGEVWQPLGLSAFVGTAGAPGPTAKVEFQLYRDANQILITATANPASSWRASMGGNDYLAYITTVNRLRILIKQTAVTATNIMISVRYLVYHA